MDATCITLCVVGIGNWDESSIYTLEQFYETIEKYWNWKDNIPIIISRTIPDSVFVATIAILYLSFGKSILKFADFKRSDRDWIAIASLQLLSNEFLASYRSLSNITTRTADSVLFQAVSALGAKKFADAEKHARLGAELRDNQFVSGSEPLLLVSLAIKLRAPIPLYVYCKYILYLLENTKPSDLMLAEITAAIYQTIPDTASFLVESLSLDSKRFPLTVARLLSAAGESDKALEVLNARCDLPPLASVLQLYLRAPKDVVINADPERLRVELQDWYTAEWGQVTSILDAEVDLFQLASMVRTIIPIECRCRAIEAPCAALVTAYVDQQMKRIEPLGDIHALAEAHRQLVFSSWSDLVDMWRSQAAVQR